MALCMKELGTRTLTRSTGHCLPANTQHWPPCTRPVEKKPDPHMRGSPVSGIVHKSSWTFELFQSQQSLHLFSCVRQPSADRHRLHTVQPDWMDARICTCWCRSGRPARYNNFECIGEYRLIASKWFVLHRPIQTVTPAYK